MTYSEFKLLLCCTQLSLAQVFEICDSHNVHPLKMINWANKFSGV